MKNVVYPCPMEITSAFIIYLTLFRLAMIAAGVVSIVLGYQLFCRGIWPEGGGGSSVEASIAGNSFTLKNAAPGTCFAMFGVFIIGLMMVQGGPEMTLKTLGAEGAVGAQNQTEVSLRGGAPQSRPAGLSEGQLNTVDVLTQEGVDFERQRDEDQAMVSYREAIGLAGDAMNYLAWLYQKNGQYDDALPLARSAVHVQPDKPAYLDTLAVVLCEKGDASQAVSLIREAARLNANEFGQGLDERVENFENGVCQ